MAHGFTTRALAQFASALQEAHVPSDVEELVSYAFADVLGTALGGRTTQVAQVIGQAAAGAGHDEAAFLLMPGRAPAEAVARVLAVQAHALDFDDVALQGHPSAVLVPAILAAAQIAPCSGRRMIAAYTAGYEAWNALAQATEKPLHLCGWHPTSSFGTIAAAAAVAKVLDLDAERTAHAFGAAASMTAGLIANFGTMVKPLQVGRAAEAGLYAARLAQAGLEANTEVLEQAGGWIDTVLQQKGGLRPPMTTALSLAERRLDFKLFPVCYCAHRSVVAALSLAERVAAHPSGVARISLRLSPLQDRTLAYRRPETVDQARFSAEFAVAVALTRGALGLDMLSEEVLRSLPVQRMMDLVERVVIDEPNVKELPDFINYEQIKVTFRDGAELESQQVHFAAGSGAFALERDALRGKFIANHAASGARGHGGVIFDRLLTLRDLEMEQIMAVFAEL